VYESKPRRRPRRKADFLAYDFDPVKPSAYDIGHATPENLPPGSRVVLDARVSTKEQWEAGHADDLMDKLKRIAEEWGWKVVYEHKWWGSSLYWWKRFPAVEAAHRFKAVVVCDTMDRLMRPWAFDAKRNFFARLTAYDMEYLARHTNSVPWGPGGTPTPLYTVEHPDAPPAYNHGVHSKRGMEATGHMGGRGNKVTLKDRQDEHRDACLEEARRLRAEGYSYPQVGRRFGVSGKTAHKWLKGG
jgi:hypothetical protein